MDRQPTIRVLGILVGLGANLGELTLLMSREEIGCDAALRGEVHLREVTQHNRFSLKFLSMCSDG